MHVNINIYLCQCRGKDLEGYTPSYWPTNHLWDKEVKVGLVKKGFSPFILHISELINLLNENISMYYLHNWDTTEEKNIPSIY